MRVSFSGAPAIYFCFLACTPQVALVDSETIPGRIIELDPGEDGETGWWPSLVFDSVDQPHLSYCDAHHGDLIYATKKNGEWTTQTVVHRGAIGKYTAIAADSRGGIGILFYDQDKKYLRYAYRKETNSRWKTESVAWGPEVGMGSELRFDANDRPIAFYYIPSRRLVRATKIEGAWQKTELAEVGGSWSVRISPHLRGTAKDRLWISYVDVAFKDTRLWLQKPSETPQDPKKSVPRSRELVSDRQGAGWRSQLLFEPSAPTPAVLYTESLTARLMMAKKIDGQWTRKLILDGVGNFAAAQSSDRWVVAYEDIKGRAAGRGQVSLLHKQGSNWERLSLPSPAPSGKYLTVALDSRGRAVAAFYAEPTRGLYLYDETSPR